MSSKHVPAINKFPFFLLLHWISLKFVLIIFFYFPFFLSKLRQFIALENQSSIFPYRTDSIESISTERLSKKSWNWFGTTSVIFFLTCPSGNALSCLIIIIIILKRMTLTSLVYFTSHACYFSSQVQQFVFLIKACREWLRKYSVITAPDNVFLAPMKIVCAKYEQVLAIIFLKIFCVA